MKSPYLRRWNSVRIYWRVATWVAHRLPTRERSSEVGVVGFITWVVGHLEDASDGRLPGFERTVSGSLSLFIRSIVLTMRLDQILGHLMSQRLEDKSQARKGVNDTSFQWQIASGKWIRLSMRWPCVFLLKKVLLFRRRSHCLMSRSQTVKKFDRRRRIRDK